MAEVDNWYYSDKVKEHFLNPRNFLVEDPKDGEFDAEGEAGNMACGDIMKVWIKIDSETKKIKDFKWRTWGCASAIAATSIFSVMITEKGGMKIEDALKITPQEIIKRLHGLPLRKIHCSVLVDKAFHNAISNYLENKNFPPPPTLRVGYG
ncbi:iron-sulfur cluster assembly scaffold protein [Patescibacteria group bacterium]|nr:iron-sulfur cluster assembly scaffold protein [Patescibacteria group bacterium]